MIFFNYDRYMREKEKKEKKRRNKRRRLAKQQLKDAAAAAAAAAEAPQPVVVVESAFCEISAEERAMNKQKASKSKTVFGIGIALLVLGAGVTAILALIEQAGWYLALTVVLLGMIMIFVGCWRYQSALAYLHRCKNVPENDVLCEQKMDVEAGNASGNNSNMTQSLPVADGSTNEQRMQRLLADDRPVSVDDVIADCPNSDHANM